MDLRLPLILMFCQTNKEDDGSRRIGSESEVLDYVEARIALSRAELALNRDGDDVKVCCAVGSNVFAS